MNRKTIQTCFGVTAVVLAFGTVSANVAAAEIQPKTPAAAATAKIGAPKMAVPVPGIYCADPSVTAINFAIVKRSTPGSGVVRITAVAKNLGKDKFEVGMLTLFKQIPGRAYTELAHTNVPVMAPGAEVSVFFDEMKWSASDEFPPTYKAMFIGDPDGPTGSIPSHRDCNVNNNEKTRSGTDINLLFR